MGGDCRSFQLIDGRGVFNACGLEQFTKTVKLHECGLSYAVVSIMGPQSSGKSTLLNHLFATNFKEMNADDGRSQITQGIWLAKGANMVPCTLVMDVEGVDGKEREDDTAFEKQSALFALVVSDIVLINMWCTEIGREHAANRPLLKTIFEVMLQVFDSCRTTLLFVIRDKTKTPFEKLKKNLTEDIHMIWDRVPKPQAHKDKPLAQFFNVDIVALPSFERDEEQFKEEVATLRQWFLHSISPSGLVRDQPRVKIAASGFSLSAQEIWKTIKENKDLDLPAHKVMVASVRCEDIAKEKLGSFKANEHWLELKKDSKNRFLLDFGRKISAIWNAYLQEYDVETIYFDQGVRSEKRQHLESEILQLVQPTYQCILDHLESRTVEHFKLTLDKSLKSGKGFKASLHDCTTYSLSIFDEGCADAAANQANWDSSNTRARLIFDIEAHISSVHHTKIAEINAICEKQLKEALEPVERLLNSPDICMWPAIRELLQRETQAAMAILNTDLLEYDVDEVRRGEMLSNLKTYAESFAECKAREEARKVLVHMKDKFHKLFNFDETFHPRKWSDDENIDAIYYIACEAALNSLSALAMIRLDDNVDNIENILFHSLLLDSSINVVDSGLLASDSWEEVPVSKTLLAPLQCKFLWINFRAEVEYYVQQARSIQSALATQVALVAQAAEAAEAAHSAQVAQAILAAENAESLQALQVSHAAEASENAQALQALVAAHDDYAAQAARLAQELSDAKTAQAEQDARSHQTIQALKDAHDAHAAKLAEELKAIKDAHAAQTTQSAEEARRREEESRRKFIADTTLNSAKTLGELALNLALFRGMRRL